MNAFRSRLFFTSGLILLLVGLFLVAYALNDRQYKTSLANTESRLAQVLEREAQVLLGFIEDKEAAGFSLFQTTRLLEADLFFIGEKTTIPACASLFPENISREAADRAFKQGIELLPSPEAVPFFEKAALGPAGTRDEVYQKIAALFNMLECRPNVQTICTILVLLEQEEVQLYKSQTAFFQTLLKDQTPNLEIIETRLAELQRLAEQIDKTLTQRKGSFRSSVAGRVLSVRGDGLALLYTPELKVLSPIELHTEPQSSLCREIIPGLYVAVSDNAHLTEKKRIIKQYHIGNVTLSLMVFLGTTLAGGAIAAIHRQRKLDAMRTEFIATVSHELRTPLSLIRLHAETLHHGRIPADKVVDYHQTILTESERLTGIVNNVLDFSRMERGRIKINLEPIDLSQCTERIINSFRFRFSTEGVEVEQDISPGITAMVDPLAWSQILFNLLDNAIKYSDDSKHIRITLESSADECTILRVEDQGIGIPDTLKKTIFDDFIRSGDSKVTARRGSGIGLSVARRLLERMSGTIEITDNQPRGSVFTVRLSGNNETTDS